MEILFLGDILCHTCVSSGPGRLEDVDIVQTPQIFEARESSSSHTGGPIRIPGLPPATPPQFLVQEVWAGAQDHIPNRPQGDIW